MLRTPGETLQILIQDFITLSSKRTEHSLENIYLIQSFHDLQSYMHTTLSNYHLVLCVSRVHSEYV